MKRIQRWHLIAIIILIFGVVLSFSPQIYQALRTHAAPVNARNAFLHPFASTSIWNTPVGTNAKYVSENWQRADVVTPDINYLITTTSSDPKVPLYQPGWQGNRCGSTTRVGFEDIIMPKNFTIPDPSPGSTPNASAAILQPDGKSLLQVAPLARCVAGGPAYGWWAGGWGHLDDIQGDGINGAHWGAGLSSIGGMIRKGELTSKDPISHALSIELWGRMYFNYVANSATPGFRWPAHLNDAYAPGPDGYCSLAPCSNDHNPALVQGSLLAIPPSVTADSLNLQTDAAKKIFTAFQNYGSYSVDDTGWNDDQINIEDGVQAEFKQVYGYNFGEGAFAEDIKNIFMKLQIIDNNTPNNIGGGGAPRAPYLAAFADGTGGPPDGVPVATQTIVPPTSTLVPGQPTIVPTATPTPISTKGNLALNKNISASSEWDKNFTAQKANDGDKSSGWSPAKDDKGPWIEVDLGEAHTLSQIQLMTRQQLDQPDTRQNFVIWASNNPDMSQGQHVVLGSQGKKILPYQSIWKLNVKDKTPYRYVAALKTDGGYFFVSELRVMGS